MKPMLSSDSRLRRIGPAFEDRNLAAVIQDVERRCRIMCRVMQVFCIEGTDGPISDLERNWEDRGDALTVFSEFIDGQMDTLSALRDEFDTGWFSINKLKGKDDD